MDHCCECSHDIMLKDFLSYKDLTGVCHRQWASALSHCWSICSPPTASCCKKLEKIGMLVCCPSPWAVLHSCTTVTGSIQGYRFACRQPLLPPTSLSNSPIKTHLSDPCHPPTHLLPVLLNSGAAVIGAFPPPQPPLCHHPLPTHPSHLALRALHHLGPKAGRQAALRFLILPNSGHSGHCLHSSCAHSADWAPR